MSKSGEHPFDALWRLQQEALETDRALPGVDGAGAGWSGIGFGVGDLCLAADLAGFTGVLDCPPVTPVPGTPPWLAGVCGVRGKLYSVVDLGLFLGIAETLDPRRGRLLVIDDDELRCALLVLKVFGLRRFAEDQVISGEPPLDPSVRRYVDGTYVQDGRPWVVVSIERLARDKKFLGVGEPF